MDARALKKMRADAVRAIAEDSRRLTERQAAPTSPRDVFILAYTSTYPGEEAPTVAEVDAVITAHPEANTFMEVVELIRAERNAKGSPP